jgi:LPXTG-motif cell wall-anchored protein
MGAAETPKTLPVTGSNDLVTLISLTMSSMGAAGYFFKKHLNQA